MDAALHKLAEEFKVIEELDERVATISMCHRTFARLGEVDRAAPFDWATAKSVWGARINFVTRMEPGLIELVGDHGTRHLAYIWGGDEPVTREYFVNWGPRRTMSGGSRSRRILENWEP